MPRNPDASERADQVIARVGKVFDGDGFLAELWHPIRQTWVRRVPFRFAFIDAPEIGQSFGSESQAFLENLIGGTELSLTLIGKQSQGNLPIDQHKRLLCMGYLTEEMQVGKVEYYLDGKCSSGTVRKARQVTRNVELEMIVNGFAWVLPQYSFEHEDEYFAAQENAKQAKRGLWTQDDPEPPWKYKQRQKRKTKAERSQPSLFSRQ